MSSLISDSKSRRAEVSLAGLRAVYSVVVVVVVAAVLCIVDCALWIVHTNGLHSISKFQARQDELDERIAQNESHASYSWPLIQAQCVSTHRIQRNNNTELRLRWRPTELN